MLETLISLSQNNIQPAPLRFATCRTLKLCMQSAWPTEHITNALGQPGCRPCLPACHGQKWTDLRMAVDRRKALSWHMQRHPLGLGRMHPDMSTCGLEGLKMLPKTTKHCGAGRGGRGGAPQTWMKMI